MILISLEAREAVHMLNVPNSSRQRELSFVVKEAMVLLNKFLHTSEFGFKDNIVPNDWGHWWRYHG
jgi:hypothetical protein